MVVGDTVTLFLQKNIPQKPFWTLKFTGEYCVSIPGYNVVIELGKVSVSAYVAPLSNIDPSNHKPRVFFIDIEPSKD